MLLSIVNAKAHEGEEVNFNVQVNLNPTFIEDKNYKFLTPAKVSGVMIYSNDQLEINSKVSFKLLAVCDNCGEEFEKTISFDFNEVFVESSKSHNEEDYVILNQTCVDLDKAVDDALLLNLPTKMLCKKNCKGLCQVCGKNKNLYDCGCENIVKEEERQENPFNTLKNNQN